MGHLGFSYVGAAYLVMLFVPNILWARNQPSGYSAQGENRVLQVLERLGEISVTCCALIFRDLNLRPWSFWSLWLAGSFCAMVLYELWWIRYFRGSKTLGDFYGTLLGIPVPGAVLPVAAFLLLGVYGRVVWLMAAAVVLGVGHIGIHLGHRREVTRQQ